MQQTGVDSSFVRLWSHASQHYVTKPGPVRQSFQKRLSKACRCSRSMSEGVHKDKCDFHPQWMLYCMQKNLDERSWIANQLGRAKGSLGVFVRPSDYDRER